MGKFIIVIIFAVGSLTCAQETMQTKFVTFDQGMIAAGSSCYTREILIKKVHAKEWKVLYGFADNNYCDQAFSNKTAQLENMILNSITSWLSPLQDKEGIISRHNIKLEERMTASVSPDQDWRKTIVPVEDKTHDLSIVFYCKDGTASAISTRCNATSDPDAPEINMYIYNLHNSPNLKNYYDRVLHHEMGHAFGLDDTYVHHMLGQNSNKFNKSTGGNPNRIGQQPDSVMSGCSQCEGAFDLAPDDIAGIKWLYRYHVDKSVTFCDCPYDYVYESETAGCRPEYPLTFAIKGGSESWSDLIGYSSEDVNRRDNFGNTALHYAAANKEHLPQQYTDFLIYIPIFDLVYDDTIVNQLGYTAQQIYDADNPRSLLYHPDDLATDKEEHQRKIAAVCSSVADWLELRTAIKETNLAEVERLLPNMNSDYINRQDFVTGSVLHYATQFFAHHDNDFDAEKISDCKEIVRLLLERPDVDLHIKNQNGQKPFATLIGRQSWLLRGCFASRDSLKVYNDIIYYLFDLGQITEINAYGIDVNAAISSLPSGYTEHWCDIIEYLVRRRAESPVSVMHYDDKNE